jgi:hypothetical protein
MRRGILFLVLATLIFAACATTGPSDNPSQPQASATATTVVVNENTKSEISTLLQRRQTALAGRDLQGFQSTIDMTRPALRRCQQESFDIAVRQGAGSGGPTVGKVEVYASTYVRAYVDEGLGYSRLYFKKDGTRWVLTEPTESELGGEKTKTVSGVDLSYWGIDEDIIDAFGQAGADTRTFLLNMAIKPPARPFAFRLFPTRESAGLTAACGTAGSSFGANTLDPFLRFYKYWVGPDFVKPADYQRSVMKHEGLHWLQEQTIPGINSRLDWWLVEGWPDYIGESRTQGAKAGAVCLSAIPTFKQLVDGPYADPNVTPERIGQFYAFANTMVEYLYATFRKDAYWDLLAEYKENVDPQVTYPKVLAITPTQFYEGWGGFAKKRYC